MRSTFSSAARLLQTHLHPTLTRNPSLPILRRECVALQFPRRHFAASAASCDKRGMATKSSGEAREPEPAQPFEKKKSTRSQTTKNSLRRVAAASAAASRAVPVTDMTSKSKTCTAYCTAEKYDLSIAATILRSKGYELDPFGTGLIDQVLHLRLRHQDEGEECDVFIFPSGNIVSWSLPSNQISQLANTILPAAENPYRGEIETEDLEYVEDHRARKSRVGGDVIIVGTAPSENSVCSTDFGENGQEKAGSRSKADELNIALAKIAFSSGLARSTKLAVLESLLDEYLQTTSNIPTLLSKGSRLPFTRPFILRKTGELLQFRAQLNLYSELTDSLPDIFWDSRHELGLEGYYDSVGRALDVNVRIHQLNEKLDYASGIVEVLRERLSERHALGLEWMIILLITVEVGFELHRLWKEGSEERREEREYRRWKERKEREEDAEFQDWKKEQEIELEM
ncbi:hypothetical protein RUND412_009946 [Rhizina undulata]